MFWINAENSITHSCYDCGCPLDKDGKEVTFISSSYHPGSFTPARCEYCNNILWQETYWAEARGEY